MREAPVELIGGGLVASGWTSAAPMLMLLVVAISTSVATRGLAMPDAFKPGDTVQLKSGGPPMTVEATEESGMIACSWMDKKKLERRSFPAAALVKYDWRASMPIVV